jgi:hypothetical protein
VDLQHLTVATFAPLVGDRFTLRAGEDVALELELVDVNDLVGSEGPPAGRRAPFSIHFRGPAEPLLPQAIRPLEHHDLGRLEIFLVPLAQDANGTRYEAVFG